MTIRPPSSLYRISYRMERADYVAMASALHRSPRSRLAFEITGYFLVVAIIGLGIAGSLDSWFRVIAGAFAMPMVMATMPLLLAGPAILGLRPQIAGLAAALIYRLNASADRDIVLDLTASGLAGGASDPSAEVGWSAVTRLIETPSHLLVQIAPREALIIPRRAVPDEDLYRNLRGFIRARTGLSTD